MLVKGGLLEGELSFCCLVEHLWSMEGLFQLTKKSGKHRRRDCGAAELFSCVPWFKGGLAESHREEWWDPAGCGDSISCLIHSFLPFGMGT